MPKTIRQALSDRIRTLPALREFLDDFQAATGLAVEFVGQLGDRAAVQGKQPLCRFLQANPGGCRLCTTTVQDLLERSQRAPAELQCDAGLRESAVPLRAGGQVFGYFLVGGYFTTPPTVAEKNGIRHRLERLKIPVAPATIDELCSGSPVVDAGRHAAMVRILSMAAAHLTLIITDNLAQPTEKLPPMVRTLCDQVRRNFLHEVSLTDIARKLGVTTAHLCRTFHHATGLRFREYVGRLRAERAREQLTTTDHSITDIAFGSGFQSLSQFNRVFQTIYGQTPREVRRSVSPKKTLKKGRGINGGVSSKRAKTLE